jgi:hypothetical protein
MRVSRVTVGCLLAFAVAMAVGWGTCAGAQPRDPRHDRDQSLWSLDVGDADRAIGGDALGARITSGVVRFDQSGGTCSPERGSRMYHRVRGIAAVLEPRDVRLVMGMVLRKPVGMAPNDQAVTLATLSLCAGGEARRVDLVQSPDGSMWSRLCPAWAGARGEGGDKPDRLESLDRERLLSMIDEQGWGAYAGRFDEPASEGKPAAEPSVVELPKPYVVGRYTLDSETISRRFLAGRPTKINKADRVLELEKLLVRSPRGYSPRNPAGLVVWISADDDGQPPGCVFPTCDAGNLIVASFAKCGNTRPVMNRYQMALDAVATVSRSYHVDLRRVYVSGISGGGRVASIVAACFPDVFSGCVPIAGLNCHEALPAGGRRYIPPAFAKPSGRLLDRWRQRRTAAITGEKDFNQPEITAAAQILRGEGVQAKVFVFAGLGHELPTAEQFSEAFSWVDEPYQKVRQGELEAGERALRSAGEADGPAKSEADRAALMRVTEVAPWTPAAWRAIERLDHP